jgi:PilZ domain-containing protein
MNKDRADPSRSLHKIFNEATRGELLAGYGLSAEFVDKIIAMRPYASELDILEKAVIPKRAYEQLRGDFLGIGKRMHDKRRHPRYPFDARIGVTTLRRGNNSDFWGRAFELGEQGVRATIVGDLSLNEVVTLKIPLPSGNEFEVRASVRYKNGFQCGFEPIAPKHRVRTGPRFFAAAW